jgi:hypothetical protein
MEDLQLQPHVIRQAYELIKDRNQWTQNASARDRWSRKTAPGPVCWGGREPVKWCAFGALNRFGVYQDTMRYLNTIAREMFDNNLVWVNDNIGHEAVVQVFEKAITNLEGGL